MLPGPRLRWVLALGLSAIIVAVVAMSDERDAASQERATPPSVTVAEPEVEAMAAWSEHSGRFVAVADVEVRPRISGLLERVHFREGQLVERNALLFTLDAAPFRAAADLARANLARAEALQARTPSEFARAETLLQVDAISREEFDARKEAAAQAVAAQRAAEAGMRSALLELQYTSIRAPVAGRISDAFIHAGNLVRAGEDVLTRIVALDPIKFEFSAPTALFTRDEEETRRPVRLQLEGEEGYVHEGVLEFVDNTVDPRTGAIRARATFANRGRFTPGDFARLRLLAPAEEPTMLIPETAILADQTERYVLLVDADNMVARRAVMLGPRLGDGRRIVRGGLDGGERIIINGVQRAYPGARVTPETAPSATNSPS